MAGIEIRVELDDRLTATLARAAAGARDLTVPMGLIAEQLLASTRGRFKAQADPLGVPWTPRRDADNPKPLLFDSGDLQRQVEQDHGRDFAAVGVLGTGGPAVYAAVHQFGATIRPKTGKALKTPFGPRAAVTVPARPFLGISELDRDRIGAILTEHLADLLNGAAADGASA